MPDAASWRSTWTDVPGRPGTQVRVEVHHPDAPRVAVLCAGLGLPLGVWSPVVAALPQVGCILFDRPGLAGSPPWEHEPGLTGQTALIGDVLDAAGVAGGTAVVLVGHSYAALHVEAFARQHPDRVAGLVLVDPSLPAHEARQRTWLEHHPAPARRALARAPWLGGPVGRVVLLAGTTPAGRRGPGAAALVGAYRAPHHLTGVLDELLRIGGEAAALLELTEQRQLSRVGVTVLAATRRPRPLAGRRTRWLTTLARWSRGFDPPARLVEVDAAHLVMLDDPGAVAAAIAQAVATA